MTLTGVAIYVVVFGLVLGRRVKGQPLTTPRRLFLLPVVVAFVGLQGLSHTTMNSADVTVMVIGSALSFGLGALRGQMNKLSTRDGVPWVRWGVGSLVVFGATVVTKLGVDAAGVAAGGSLTALSRSLVFTLGLSLLGEAVVVWLRTQSTTPRPSFSSPDGR